MSLWTSHDCVGLFPHQALPNLRHLDLQDVEIPTDALAELRRGLLWPMGVAAQCGATWVTAIVKAVMSALPRGLFDWHQQWVKSPGTSLMIILWWEDQPYSDRATDYPQNSMYGIVWYSYLDLDYFVARKKLFRTWTMWNMFPCCSWCKV